MLGIRHYKGLALDLFEGDLTEFVCDVMVNAANESLAGGSGVDGAIHQAGGPSIMEECQSIGKCPTGEAVMTNAGKLPAQKLIHTVGPIWKDGASGEEDLLKNAYLSSLRLANKEKMRHIAFPSISTGAYGYPVQEAAKVAFKAFKQFADENSDFHTKRITIVLFSRADHNVYQDELFAQFPEEK